MYLILNPYCHGLKHFSSVTGGGSWSPRTQSAPDSTKRLIGGQNFYPVSLGIYTLRLWRKKVEKMSRSFTATVQKIFKNFENCSILPFKEFFTYKKICDFNFESLQLHTQEWYERKRCTKMTVGHLLEKSINKMRPHQGFFFGNSPFQSMGAQEAPPPWQ